MSDIARFNCAICGPALTVHQRYLDGLCGDWQCRKAVLQRAIDEHRAVASEALSIGDADAHFSFVVPNNEGRIKKLSERRRKKFRAHLRRVFRAVAEPDDETTVDCAAPGDRTADAREVDEQVDVHTLPVRETTLLRGACAACRGTCCKDGGDHAFLDRDRMARLMEENPGRGANSLMESYLSYLPETSFQNGCVYQAEIGCTLPREMRADICNGYECAGLKSFRRRLEDSGPTKGFAVVREDNRIIRSTFFDECESRGYPQPPDGSTDSDDSGTA